MRREYLYHYTSIETLELILKNKTIRFNSLHNMDDPLEGLTKDTENLGCFCFISCWTESENSIPMWDRYSDLKTGVCIKLRKYPFKTYTLNSKQASQLKNMVLPISNKPNEFESIIPFELLNSNNYFFPTLKQEDILHKVKYFNSDDDILPKIIENHNDDLWFRLDRLGKNKKACWDYQKEWRYIIMIYPSFTLNPDLALNTTFKMFTGEIKPEFKYFDLKIDEDVFKDMEIILGPLHDKEQEEKVKSLIAQYNPSAKIEICSLTGYLRC